MARPEHAGKPVNVEGVVGTLNTFIVKPFAPHPSDTSVKHFLFLNDLTWSLANLAFLPYIGNVDAKEAKITLPVNVPPHCQDTLINFLARLYLTYVDLHYNYLEINPLWAIGCETSVAAQGSNTFADRGPPMVFPAPFGHDLTQEEAYIQKLDTSTGASLKLTVLNAQGWVWKMVAGGGASVVYSDAICAHGFAHKLANCGKCWNYSPHTLVPELPVTS
ncbi:ATP citrate (Pro-S)-lyase [Puccinia sorghi]|uniref:ATP citrate (Pro-S)-lyase n=1 Tax=Puccinia sorghi TaxID=27349 RepID=A0A0L6UH78_9BASI|nr:ATP citrate (Pro-S)-lyase [Puccinia sorghi]